MLRNILAFFTDSFFIALALFVIIYAFVARINEVSGTSMYPELLNGERIVNDHLTYYFRDPKRGDIIILNSPNEEERQLIKRIIALPGETIKLSGHEVYVNGRRLNEPYVNENPDYSKGIFLKEELEYRVPEGKYIFMGDNRNHSFDSRDMGPVTKKEIVGKAFLRFWPLTAFKIFQTPKY